MSSDSSGQTKIKPIDKTGDIIMCANGLVVGNKETGKGMSPMWSLFYWTKQGVTRCRIRIDPIYDSSNGK